MEITVILVVMVVFSITSGTGFLYWCHWYDNKAMIVYQRYMMASLVENPFVYLWFSVGVMLPTCASVALAVAIYS